MVGPYRIERLLGRGGMADVYYAVHEDLLRPAAIKILRAALASDDQHLHRFQQEARAAASLVHPNIVQVYDVRLEGPYRYIAQEYIPGMNLRQYMSQSGGDASDAEPPATASTAAGNVRSTDRPLPIGETLSILLQILAALTKSHRAGIVHRDIKPENIMLTQEGDAKVADFGLARVLYGDDPQLTQAGTTMGTPLYMSPEQIQDGKVDVRSDLYSLGVTLYHMLTGHPPFTGDTPLALAMKHVQSPPPDVRQERPDIPESLAELVMRLLAKAPEDRFADPMQVLDFLREHRAGDLAEHWPDSTIPLPRVAPRGGPYQATVELHSRLLAHRRRRRRRAALYAAGLVLGTTAFAVGFAATYRTQVLPQATATVFRDIPRQESAREQYMLALLSRDLHGLDKWEAVAFYFPPLSSESNRTYAAQATLQLARALEARREFESALRTLDRVIGDPQVADVYRVLAWLQKAHVYDALEDDAKFQSAFEAARKIVSQPTFPTGDRQKINEVVKRLSPRLSRLWLGD